MGVMDKLIRLLQDEYKVGVESRSRKPIIYIDPEKIDVRQLEIDNKKDNLDGVAAQMAEQLDASSPGLSQKFTRKELLDLINNSLKLGPFAFRPDNEAVINNGPICIINEAKDNEIAVDQIYNTWGIAETFNPAHLKPLPGNNGTWAKVIGEHEGEHCNQDGVYNKTPDAAVKTLGNEVLSDRAALETLRKEGKHDVATAFIAIRAIVAADSLSSSHSTSIFLDDPEFNGVTQEHLDAATSFCKEMNIGVAAHLNMSADEADILRKSDPQHYAKVVEEALQQGKIPGFRDISEDHMQDAIAKKMGITGDELKTTDVVKVSQVYQQMKAADELQDKGPQNPHVTKYINSYISATKVLFVADTTPAVSVTLVTKPTTEAEAPTEPEVETLPSAEEITEQLDKELKNEADYAYSKAMDKLVGKATGLDDGGLDDLFSDDPDKYYEILEQELQKTSGPLQTSIKLPQEQIDERMAKKLGVPVKELYNQPAFMLHMAQTQLEKTGALDNKQENPYLKNSIEEKIKKYRQDKLDAEAESAAKTPSDEPVKPDTAQPSGFRSAATTSIKTDQNLTSSFSEVAANKPIQPAPDQGMEIKDIALTTKVAQNSQTYLSVANFG